MNLEIFWNFTLISYTPFDKYIYLIGITIEMWEYIDSYEYRDKMPKLTDNDHWNGIRAEKEKFKIID